MVSLPAVLHFGRELKIEDLRKGTLFHVGIVRVVALTLLQHGKGEFETRHFSHALEDLFREHSFFESGRDNAFNEKLAKVPVIVCGKGVDAFYQRV
jgi:hypothetical protein